MITKTCLTILTVFARSVTWAATICFAKRKTWKSKRSSSKSSGPRRPRRRIKAAPTPKLNKNKNRAVPSRSILTELARQKVKALKLRKFNKIRARMRSLSRPKRECVSRWRRAHHLATITNRLVSRPSILRKAMTVLPKPKLGKHLAMRVTDQKRIRLSLNLTLHHRYNKSKRPLRINNKLIRLLRSQSPWGHAQADRAAANNKTEISVMQIQSSIIICRNKQINYTVINSF